MKNKRLVFYAIIFILILTFSGCTSYTEPDDKKDSLEKFHVNEWGVFIKSYDCKDSDILTYPTDFSLVRKAVIYFHQLIDEKRVNVEIKNIRNATVIPTSDSENISIVNISENRILWNVTVVDEKIKTIEDNYLNYLFYEGDINFDTKVLASITKNKNNIEYYVKNSESYDISNVFLIFGNTYLMNNTDDDFIECVYFGDLSSNEEKTILNDKTENIYSKEKTKDEIKDNLISLSLTENESSDLIDYWKEWWFTPTSNKNYTLYSRLIYTIPQNIYDTLLPISIIPEPYKINRLGLVSITELPYDTNYSNNFISSVVTGTGMFSFHYDVDIIDVSEIEIHVTNPDGVKDEIRNLENGSKVELNDGYFRWIDEVENGIFGDGNDHIDVYNNDGLIAGEWNVKVIEKSKDEVLYSSFVTIGSTDKENGPGVYVG